MTNAYRQFVGTDGTYLYWYAYSSTKNPTYRPVKVVRSDGNIANFSNVYLLEGSANAGSFGFDCNSTGWVVSVSESGDRRTEDGTNEYAVLGKVSIAGDKVHICNAYTTNQMYQLDQSDLTENWNQTYSDVLIASKIVEINSNFYLVGTTNGDFDGDHSGNTDEEFIVAKLYIADGSIG